MTHAALSPLIGPEFDAFLGAPIGEDRNGTTLSVLSALARLDVDPWQEATSLARMQREAAAERLSALIDALPREPTSEFPSQTSVADLVALLPKGKTPNVRQSDIAFGAIGPRQTPLLIGLSAFVMMMLIVFAISALFSPGSGTGANPPAPHAADATMAASPKPGP
jgi:hypothetical protein